MIRTEPAIPGCDRCRRLAQRLAATQRLTPLAFGIAEWEYIAHLDLEHTDRLSSIPDCSSCLYLARSMTCRGLPNAAKFVLIDQIRSHLARHLITEPWRTTVPPTEPDVPAALMASAEGEPGNEAAVWLLTEHGHWLRQLHHHGYITYFDDHTYGRIEWVHVAAACEWPLPQFAQAPAEPEGGWPYLHGSGSERGMLAIAASLDRGVPVDLRDALSSLDGTNLNLALCAMLWSARGRREAERRFPICFPPEGT